MNKAWEAILIVLVLAAASLMGAVFLHDHSTTSYYLEQYGGSGGAPFCVDDNVPWGPDMHAFCSADIDKVLQVLQAANASLKKEK